MTGPISRRIPESGTARSLLIWLILLCGGTTWAASPLVLRSSDLALELDPVNGTIARIQDVTSGIALTPPAGMAENFRLTLFKADKTTALIHGREQKLSSAQLDGEILTLAWAGPLRDAAGAEHDLRVRMVVQVAGASLTFTMHVDNHTQAKVREAWYPLVGGMTGFHGPGQPGGASIWIPTSTPLEKPVTLPFANVACVYPGQMNLSFACIQGKSAGRSIYFASHDTVARLKTYHVFQVDGPEAKEIFLGVQHHPFTLPGARFDGSPVVFRFIDGDWRAAARIYRDWFDRTFGIMQPSADWIRQQSFFLMTMFMLPEGTINYTFKDIPKWARAAKNHGLNAVQISGWQLGGHDNGYPFYTIDPRLGTWQELEDGIRACHKMGVKVYFFVNYQPMMVESDRYKNELHRYREMREDGGYTWMAGWGMGTLWARMGHPKLMTWANLAFPQYRRLIVDDFSRLAQIGADGVHVDKMFPAGLEFNPDSPLSPDTAGWEGAVLLTKEIMQACRKHNPAWAMSFECNWDRMLQFGGATWWVGNQRITRQVFPEHAETLGLYQACDYLGVNNAVRDGHIVMVAPLNFCRDLDWPPFAGLADYIQEVKQIRDRLRETVFFAEVLGQAQVRFQDPVPDGVQHNVFRNRTHGRRVCILTSSRREPRQLTFLGFEGSVKGRVRIYAPGDRRRTVRLPAVVTIPGERITFVEELGGAP